MRQPRNHGPLTAPSNSGLHGPRRRRSAKLSPLQVAGLFLMVALCGAYIYFVSHSPQLSQDYGFRRHTYRRQAWQSEPRSLRFGSGDEAGNFPATRGAADAKLLLASHNRLLWYHYTTGRVEALHEGKGVYYGVFPGKRVDAQGRPTSAWVVSRPHNWKPKSTLEQLLEIDMTTGDELGAVQLDSRFTHDVARRGDRVYVCSTEQGTIVELALPGLKQARKMELFTLRQHINSVAPLEPGALWGVLHNLGQSELVRVDLKTAAVTKRFKGVGTKSHAIVAWRGSLLVLDSEAGGLLRVNPHNGSHTTLWKVPEGGRFLKGLAVVDDVAFFGMSVWSDRAARGDPAHDSQLAAFCLRGMALLWRHEVPTHGLLNIVAAPHLAIASTYRALEPGLPRPKKDPAALVEGSAAQQASAAQRASDSAADGVIRHRTAARTLSEFPALVGGRWASGQAYMDVGVKRQQPLKAGIQLNMLRVDVKPLQAALAAAGEQIWQQEEQRRTNAFFDGRLGNMQKFKPGVEPMILLFSDRAASRVFTFPWYYRFAAVVEPLLRQVVGQADMAKIIRLQFARMRPGIRIKPHTDLGQWASRSHRIHIPVTAAPGVGFAVCPDGALQHSRIGHLRHDDVAGVEAGPDDCWPVALGEGQVFELNNALPHKVDNNSSVTRIHLIVDVSETPHERIELKPGQSCLYDKDTVIC